MKANIAQTLPQYMLRQGSSCGCCCAHPGRFAPAGSYMALGLAATMDLPLAPDQQLSLLHLHSSQQLRSCQHLAWQLFGQGLAATMHLPQEPDWQLCFAC